MQVYSSQKNTSYKDSNSIHHLKLHRSNPLPAEECQEKFLGPLAQRDHLLALKDRQIFLLAQKSSKSLQTPNSPWHYRVKNII